MPKGINLKQSLRVSKTVICRGCKSNIILKGGRRNAKYGHWCITCRSNPNIKSFRNVINKGVDINFEEFVAAYEVERCQCCDTELVSGGLGRSGRNVRQIDHCHDTGKVRGVICWNCNTSIGKLGDSVEGLEKAISYLKGE